MSRLRLVRVQFFPSRRAGGLACTRRGLPTLRRLLWLLVALAGLLLHGPQGLWGQSSSAPAEAPPGTTAQEDRPLIQQRVPVHLRDHQGKLVPVPGLTLEELDRLRRRDLPAPSYVIDRLEISGTLQRQDRVKLHIHIQVSVTQDRWVKIPLRLKECVLTRPPQYQGQGTQLLSVQPDQQGYVWLLHDEQARRDRPRVHRLMLEASVPVQVQGSGKRVDLSVPLSTLSELTLELPETGLEAQAVGGKDFQQRERDSRTELSLRGLEGLVSLRWSAGERTAGRDQPPRLEVQSLIVARVGGPYVRAQATLTVRSHGGPFDRVRVRLPKGAELIDPTPSEPVVRITPVPETPGVVQLLLRRATQGPVSLRLGVRWRLDASAAESKVQLEGFEVLGALRHWGHLALQTGGGWEVYWEVTSPHVKQVARLPEQYEQTPFVAAFEFWKLPLALPLLIRRPRSHVYVEPEYVVYVREDRLELRATYRTTVRGAQLAQLSLPLGDWVLDRLEPDSVRESIVNPGSLVSEESGSAVLQLALKNVVGTLQWTIVAHQVLDPEQTRLQFSLPVPQADKVAAGMCWIQPANHIRLQAEEEALTGLELQQQLRKRFPGFEQPAVAYRVESPENFYQGTRRILPPQVVAARRSRIVVHADRVQVEERVRLRVYYQPLDSLLLELSQAIDPVAHLQITEGEGKPLVFQPEEAPQDRPPGTRRYRLLLPEAVQRQLQLTIRYELPVPALASDRFASMPVPLTRFVGVSQMTDQAELVAAKELLVDVEPQRGWNAQLVPGTSSQEQRFQLQSQGEQQPVVLLLRLPPQQAARLILPRVWVQSWITPQGRVDRAVFVLRGAEGTLRFRLPQGSVGGYRVLVDGEVVTARPAGTHRLELTLPPPRTPRRTRCVEIHYQIPRQPLGAHARLEVPQVEGNVWVDRTYWQLILPPGQHALAPGAGWAPLHRWRWRWGVVLVRQPLLSQQRLEKLCQATALPAAAESGNVYLYTRPGAPAALSVWVFPIGGLLFSGSVLGLAAALAVYRWSRLRHPLVLMALATAAVLVAAVWGEIALLGLQAMSVGMGLGLLAALWDRRTAAWDREPTSLTPAELIWDGGSTRPEQTLPSGGTPTESLGRLVPISSKEN